MPDGTAGVSSTVGDKIDLTSEYTPNVNSIWLLVMTGENTNFNCKRRRARWY